MMQLPPMRESDVMVIRSLLTETAERLRERRRKLPGLIAKHEARLQELRAEQRDAERRYSALADDEEHGRPGLAHLLNEQLNLFDPDAPDSPKPSFSLGRRGHPAPIHAPIAAARR